MIGFMFPSLAQQAFALLVSLSACPSHTKIDVNLSLEAAEPVYIYSKDSHELTRMAGPYKGQLGYERRVMGMTTGTFDAGVQTSFIMNSVKPGVSMCMTLSGANMRLVFRPVIYVASDAKGEQCRKNILQHELKHRDTDLEGAEKNLSSLRFALDKAVQKIGRRGPFLNQDLGLEQARVADELRKAMGPVLSEISARQLKEHAEHDRASNRLPELRPCSMGR